jgi:hypothetical protein
MFLFTIKREIEQGEMKIKKNNPDDLVFHYIVSFYKEM